ncbi:MAG: hypothetical protein VCA35_07355, partial [Roseibacillus sp.]
MKSIQRLVLALLVFCGGALCAIFMNPRKDTKRDNEPSSSLWDQVAAAGQAATPSLRWEETGFEAEPARSVLASSVLKDASAPSGNSKSAGNAPAIVFAEPSFKPKAMTPDEAIARLLRKPVDLANPLARRNLVAKVARLEAFKMQQTKAKALALGLPLRTPDGAVLAGFEGDHPLYDIDHNVRAAISTAADLVQASP